MTSEAHIELTEAELNPRFLRITDTLSKAVEIFQDDTDLRLLAIVDAKQKPVGAIFERDIRRLLLNPFGHALLRNRSYNRDLAGHVHPCPSVEMSHDVAALIAHYRRCEGREGMILTSHGRLYATLTNRRLVLLSAEHEQRTAQIRVNNAERIASAGRRLENDVGSLAQEMVRLADSVQSLAERTAARAGAAGEEATSAAAASVQTRESLTKLSNRGETLALALGRIERHANSNRELAGATEARVRDGRDRASKLLEAARDIDSVMALVSEIAGTVNLLSLNATIEAARAGDAGRGFAVVAGEIRKLSDQTQEATLAIGGQVHALQAGIERVAADYGDVVETIATMAAGATEIDEAVSREASTTRLIATSVHDAEQASATIEQAVATIAHSAESAAGSAKELDRMAAAVRAGVVELRNHVGGFLSAISN